MINLLPHTPNIKVTTRLDLIVDVGSQDPSSQKLFGVTEFFYREIIAVLS